MSDNKEVNVILEPDSLSRFFFFRQKRPHCPVCSGELQHPVQLFRAASQTENMKLYLVLQLFVKLFRVIFSLTRK